MPPTLQGCRLFNSLNFGRDMDDSNDYSGLLDDSYDYTLPFDIVYYAAKSLPVQCEILGIPLKKITMPFSGPPEPAVLNYFSALGYEGKHCEGKYIFLVIHALILD